MCLRNNNNNNNNKGNTYIAPTSSGILIVNGESLGWDSVDDILNVTVPNCIGIGTNSLLHRGAFEGLAPRQLARH